MSRKLVAIIATTIAMSTPQPQKSAKAEPRSKASDASLSNVHNRPFKTNVNRFLPTIMPLHVGLSPYQYVPGPGFVIRWPRAYVHLVMNPPPPQ